MARCPLIPGEPPLASQRTRIAELPQRRRSGCFRSASDLLVGFDKPLQVRAPFGAQLLPLRIRYDTDEWGAGMVEVVFDRGVRWRVRGSGRVGRACGASRHF